MHFFPSLLFFLSQPDDESIDSGMNERKEGMEETKELIASWRLRVGSVVLSKVVIFIGLEERKSLIACMD